MSRLRASMLLLGMCVVAILIGVLRLFTSPTPPPTSSSYSADGEGSLALYTWLAELGAQTQRLSDTNVDPSVSTLLVLEPESLIDAPTRRAFDAVADQGGTLVVAGDSIQWLLYARALGITVDPAPETSSVTTPDGLHLRSNGRFRVHADNAEPVLLREDGDWLGLRMPYRQGNVVVIGSAVPFSNAGLADPDTARFVFRTVVGPAQGQTVAFDEIERGPAAGAPGPATVNSLLFGTPTGLAIVYAALLTFVFLLLTGRRLGPAIVGRTAAESQRTMYEHVQMLANLYRRAGQLGVVRDTFSRHYARRQARGSVSPRRAGAFAEALNRVQSARSESELVAAVAAIDDTL